jgi:protein SCO1/2
MPENKFSPLLPLFLFGFISFCCLVSCNSTENSATKVADTSLPYYSDPSFTPHWFGEGIGKISHTISSFRLVNQLGDTVGSAQLKGRVYVAGFFFTACPGICRNLVGQLKRVQAKFIKEEQVKLICFSVTPEHDHAQRLHQYAVDNGINAARWWLLTGNRDSIYQLARKDFFADEDLGMKKGSSDFLHTENLLLIDQHGQIRGIYKGTAPVEVDWLIKDIEKLLHP